MQTELSKQWLNEKIEREKKKHQKLNQFSQKTHYLKQKLLKSKDPESISLANSLTTYQPPKIETYR